MACMQFTNAVSFRPEQLSGARTRDYQNLPRRKSVSFSFAGIAAEMSPAQPGKPEIELEFIGPKPGNDGSYPVESAKAISGEKLLRDVMSDNKIELYATYGKLMNCGGGGSCGTCIVEIIDGKDLLNERTNTELKYLKKKPESWRLACQTIVGNKENSGKVVVQRIPQWKK
ncbi:photosynthetic NDH subunit of subcomplex B 3, chloroplastic [Prunus avium]|uniref:Photosynthetic NDH subunit of subcomplex B 3, chloroplastic n=1 Tax=Prunus avium TaxID=42229 RepID=A0A6P5TDU3_PRUAV|nr:photosynthetic NDH subunit of subcomplex B 3, chloroplastic [Prunus avium]